ARRSSRSQRAERCGNRPDVRSGEAPCADVEPLALHGAPGSHGGMRQRSRRGGEGRAWGAGFASATPPLCGSIRVALISFAEAWGRIPCLWVVPGERERSMSEKQLDKSKRVFLVATSAVGGAVAVGAAVPFAVSMMPSERAKALGAPVEVDISKLAPGEMIRVEWR